MKIYILILGFLISLFGIWSFSNPADEIESKSGIQFFKGTFQEALIKAKEENKPVFVDVYATWCGPCKQLKKKTFKDKEVGDYYNKNFINVAVDGESKEGAMVARKYNVQGYPTLLIVDAEGNLKTRQMGFVEPHILVNFGKRIVL